MNYYLYITTILFVWLAVIWNSKNWLNLTYKFVFISLAVSGGLLTLQTLGYVVKAAS